MKKWLFLILFFYSFASEAQIVRKLIGLNPSGDMPGFIYRDTVYNLSNTPNQYFTGYGTWGNFLDTARLAISLTTSGTSGPATYTTATGVLNIPEYATGGSGGSRWFRDPVTFDIWRDSANVGINVDTPWARLHIRDTTITTTTYDSLGVMIGNDKVTTSTNMFYSPPLAFFGRVSNAHVKIRQYLMPPHTTTNWPKLRIEDYKSAGTGSGPNYNLAFQISRDTSIFRTNFLGIGSLATTPVTLVDVQGPAGNVMLMNIGADVSTSEGWTGMTIGETSGTSTLRKTGIIFIRSAKYSTAANGSGHLAIVSNNSTSANVTNAFIHTNFHVDKSVVIGDSTNRVASAKFTIKSINRGFLPPRMTTGQRDSILRTVATVNITAGGSGYSTVGFTFSLGGPVETATATGTLSGGVVVSATVTNGGLYAYTPTVTVSGSGGSGATATATLEAFPDGLVIYNLTTSKLQCWSGGIWNDLF